MKLKAFIRQIASRRGREEVIIDLFNLDGSEYEGGGGGSSVVQIHSVESLPQQDLELAEDLVLTFPVEAGDLLDITLWVQVTTDEDPDGQSPQIHIVENADPSLLENGTEPGMDYGVNVNLAQGQWYTVGEPIQPAGMNSVTWLVRTSGTLMVTFSTDIAAVEVPVQMKNWQVIARHYSGGG